MPKATIGRQNDNRCLYDSRLNWAAKGLMMTLINHERFEGEIIFEDTGSAEWHDTRDALQALEFYGYIHIERDESNFDVFIL